MFFLLRMAFWLGVVCVLLPSGTKTASPDSQIDATQAMTLATAAVSDARGFCERQPDACKVGGKVAVALGHKAEAGARTLYDFVTTKLAERSAGEQKAASKTEGKAEPKVLPVSNVDHGTLTQSDLATPWHGRVPLPPRRAERPARPSV
ncbi:MAG TPA: DUF5330 domain-containing protein [Pseudolabrys sp.]|nr:DUF5330 domain-containing protein [Pseudolabrys sp.]HZT27293.1 DUF5330 domain-containing protein [Pseudolabrys sp.]